MQGKEIKRKKKFFTAISLTSQEERKAQEYSYDESCEIDKRFSMKVHNPIMPFIMDKVEPGEEIDFYLVVCKGDCLGDGESDEQKWFSDEENKGLFDSTIDSWIKKRLDEIIGEKNIELLPYEVPFEIKATNCDFFKVREVFRLKNPNKPDFKCNVHLVTDDKSDSFQYVNAEENKYWLNTSKAYVQLLLTLIDLVEDNDILYIDTTYGYKPLVNIWRSFCTYSVRVRKGVQIGAFSYGSLYGVTNPVPRLFNHRAFLVMDEILSNSYDNESGGIIIRGLLTDLLEDDWVEDENEDDD